ncbi:GerMN domain-containing protein [Nocardioides sp. SYSU DS0651]|uniref:GerMN domain-containing protein n=1 Tax=Nocardioides sp. SYSU DS0651 TaxID=3415955 RepID=UPI003F4C0BCC
MLSVRGPVTVPISVLVAVLATVLLGACGVPLQDEPHPVPTRSADLEPETDAGGAAYTARVFLVSGDALAPVVRETDDRSVRSVLDLLAAGPTREEREQGLSTALGAGRFDARLARSQRPGGPVVVVVSVPSQFLATGGDEQLLAAAQVVWTVTAWRESARVRMEADGRPIELPTDRGLTGRSVTRADYRSVAPADPDADQDAEPG